MLECRACVQRCIRAVAGDEITAQNLRRPLLLTPNLATRPSRRPLATATAVRNDAPEDALSTHVANLDEKTPNRLSKAVASKGNDEKALRKELEWLKDPVKFADHVHYTLRAKNIEKATNLCRLASKSMSCIVAWNHIIDWYVKNDKVNAAIDIYNEMKKRGQFPDSYTYMLLFRAVPLQKSKEMQPHHSKMASKAVAIYNSMSSPTSRVKPSIMHTNAVLRLCSLVKDMDLLWSVASKLPDSGPGSADHITYGILLSAIRFGAMGPDSGEMVYVERIAENRNQAVNEGRRIWQEIIPRWRAGEVIIDAALVRSMAKLLTYSKRMEDWDDVLNLVQQTTNIPRLIPPLGSPERKTGHVPQLQNEDAANDVEEQHSNSEDNEGWVPTPASNAFKSVQKPTNEQGHHKKRASLAYVKPENGILNVLLEACTNMRIPKTAHEYWDLFTKDYKVHPDLDNYESMLRLLRINRSSRRVVQLMTEMREEGVRPEPRTWRIAMATCARDKNNTNVVENMTLLVDEMMKTTKYPDISTLDEYLNIAVITENKAATAKALERTYELVHTLNMKAFSDDTQPTPEFKDRVIKFYRHVTGCIDSFSKREGVEKKEAAQWQKKRAEADSLIAECLGRSGTEMGKRWAKGRFERRVVRRSATRREMREMREQNQERQERRGKKMDQKRLRRNDLTDGGD